MKEMFKTFFTTLPEKYKSIVSSLEISKHMSSVTFEELARALRTLKQSRIMRKEGFVEGDFQDNSKINEPNKGRKKINKQRHINNYKNQGGSQPPFPYCKKANHSQQKC